MRARLLKLVEGLKLFITALIIISALTIAGLVTITRHHPETQTDDPKPEVIRVDRNIV